MNQVTHGNDLYSATEPVVRSFLTEAHRKHYTGGVLGIRARPSWDSAEKFTHDGRQVVVVPCASTLAVWEALKQRGGDDWLVVLTPCQDDDLGAGILSHLVYQRLRTPDPWQAVKEGFGAARIEPGLFDRPNDRAFASGVLRAEPEGGWPPAPGGVLTQAHVFHTLVRAQLELVDRDEEVDARSVLAWSTRSDATTRLAELRRLAGDALTDGVIDWIASRCGLLERPVGVLLRSGMVAELVPLGLISGVLVEDTPEAIAAAGVLQGRYGYGRPTRDALTAWYADALDVVARDRQLALRAAETATSRLREMELSPLAARSEVLPAGLAARIDKAAEEIDRILPHAMSDDVDAPAITADLTPVEQAAVRVREHRLAEGDRTVEALVSTLRLLRWLATDTHVDPTLHAVTRRHIDADAWVDSAAADLLRGSSESSVAEVFSAVLDLVRRRRDAHDRAFADRLAAAEEPDELLIEQVLPDYLIPLAKTQPILLIVVDALTLSAATELVRAAGEWVEYALPGQRSRVAALATLPTLTKFSRCSLFAGQLSQGDAAAETRGFAQLLTEHQLNQTPGAADVPLFHRQNLETVRSGLSLAPAVQNSIADVKKHRLVAAVLNIVDDTLHHADPIGAEWNLDTITHLRPLLDAARKAGRMVVLTSDHGHVVERRDGESRPHTVAYGKRARTADPEPGAGEVLVRGPRVMTDDRNAVLAVDERIRYGSLNAGYHGGASPAEVVVPLVLLCPGDAPVGAALTPLSTVEPAWWTDQPAVAPAAMAAPGEAERERAPGKEADWGKRLASTDTATLFDLPHDEAEAPAPKSSQRSGAAALAKKVVSSKTFARQKDVAGRLTITNDRIRDLLTALLAAPGARLAASEAAAVLGVAPTRLRGALSRLKGLLDVEGYEVLRYEDESDHVVLDEAMLREQFGLPQ